MKRPCSADRQLARIKQWREICPDLTLRSTFIVGFPGETEEDFQMLLDFLKEARLDRVGCFKYSPVEGATANELADRAGRGERRALEPLYAAAAADLCRASAGESGARNHGAGR